MALPNIYFGGSISAGRQDASLYGKIIKELQKYGTVLTEHVGNDEKCVKDADAVPKYVHDRDLEWMLKSDVLVAEVTVPSLGVGYEIGRAVEKNIPILCLYRPGEAIKRLSCMIDGAHNGTTFIVKHYKEEEFPAILQDYFSSFKKS